MKVPLLCSPDQMACIFVSLIEQWDILSSLPKCLKLCVFTNIASFALQFSNEEFCCWSHCYFTGAEDVLLKFLSCNWWEEHVFSALVKGHLCLCLMFAYYCHVTALSSETHIFIYRLCNCALRNNSLPSYCREKSNGWIKWSLPSLVVVKDVR